MNYCKNRNTKVFAIEKDFRFPVGKRVLRGIIDRIDLLPDGSYEVIDYKTHAELWPQEKIDSDLQLTLYALGCKHALGIVPGTLSLFFLAHNKIISTLRTEQDEENALKLFNDIGDKIEKNEFVPNTQNCTKCDFKKSCKFSTERKK